MQKSLILRAIVMWLLFLPVPIINGLLREKWYKPVVGDLAAHWIGVFVVSAVFLLYAYVAFRGRIGTLGTGQLWATGALWLLLTVAFEFGIGLAAGRSWSYMLSDYNIAAGRIWPLVLLTTVAAPWVARWLSR